MTADKKVMDTKLSNKQFLDGKVQSRNLQDRELQDRKLQDRKLLDEKLVQVRPAERQIRHQQMEFYGFVHFTVNTFTGKEWGDGTESESIFAPSELDAGQWARAAKAAGMTGLILTCKHHDGFCLWPSAYTTHTVANSPYRGGKGDVVRELSDACREQGLKFGVYLSPWDRNCQVYGQGTAYDDYFVAQLTELLTGYGPVFCVWFDGACGEGPNGKKQVYDWERYYRTIRELQPDACISVSGPDIRWCGNEAGDTRPSEWSVVPGTIFDQRKITENSQQADDTAFRDRKLSDTDKDLGSRSVMETAERAIWYPAEVNTSIRPGWFYHEEEDDKVKSLEELQSVYLRAVGGNATFLLNIPPDKRGLFHETDETRLRELGEWIHGTFDRKKNLADTAMLIADCAKSGHGIEGVLTDSYDTFWQPQAKDTEEDCPEAFPSKPFEIELRWKEVQEIRYLVLKEAIPMSQRVEQFEVLSRENLSEKQELPSWKVIAAGTTIGYQKIVAFPKPVKTACLKIRITDSRMEPTISYLGVFSGR